MYNANADSFDDIALALFRFQVQNNPIYSAWVNHLGVNPSGVHSPAQIPFAPISLFKTHTLASGQWPVQTTFTSTGTTGAATSRHHLPDLSFYLRHAERNFRWFFGDLRQYHLLALLPSYLERSGSSLIAMIDHFIHQTGSDSSGYYLHDHDRLVGDVARLKNGPRKLIVWGVSFALLELAEKYPDGLEGCLVFETGGMKGRRRELTRPELHHQLTAGLHVDKIYSEYGMTELMSQAYTTGGQTFRPPPWMKVTARDLADPLTTGIVGETGALNITDLANFHSLAFIATDDLGRVYEDGSFEVLGRMDNSDVRGCNLMVG